MARKTNNEPTTEDFLQIDFADEMKTSFRDYAMSVIVARALPDIRDGLKPVQRRILYAMLLLGLDPKKPHRKSARVVGDTMGKFHPHGDSSIYEALVHMSENFSLSLPLVDGHGNFGSIDGDPAAAMRYTEARLTDAAMILLNHLDENLVDFIPNFDESEKEPTVLPAFIPNLLINGTTGIAVGMATSIPPHNPGEVLRAAIRVIEEPLVPVSELMSIVKGPDFPTGGIVTNADELLRIYETGEGKIKIRGKYELEKSDGGRTNIVFTEIPYTMTGNKQKLVEALVDLMKDKTFDEIYDVRDESSKEGIRIVIEVKKERDIDNLLSGLFKKSPLEGTYSVNLLAVKDMRPETFSLKSMLEAFVEFQEEIYTKYYKNLLEKSEKRLEIVDGLIHATDVIDLIIEVLRGSKDIKMAKGCLIKGITDGIKFKSEKSKEMAETFCFTENQADAILQMPLSRLIGLELQKLMDEQSSLKATIKNCKKILGSKKELDVVIIKNLKEYEAKFDTPRKTQLIQETKVEYVAEEVVEDLVLLIDKFDYVKCIDEATFAKMDKAMLSDYVHIIRTKSDDKLCIFTDQGNLYQIKTTAFPKCKLKDKGTVVNSLCKMGKEDIIAYITFSEMFESQLLFITKSGLIKRVSGIEFETNRGVIATTKLEEFDYLTRILFLSGDDVNANNRKVILITSVGLSLGFMLEEVPELKKTSKGVKGITLDKRDFVVSGSVVSPTDEVFFLNGNAYNAKKVKVQKRGGKGSKTGLQMVMLPD